MPHIQVQRGSTNKTVGGAQLCLESNLVLARDAWRVQTKPCAHQGLRERISDLQRRLWTCLWVCEYLLQRHGSAMACLGDRGSGCSRWHKSSWRRLALAPPKSCQADNPQTGEQLYQRSSCAVAKVLEPTTDSPTCGSRKGTENPQGIWLWRPVGFDCRTPTGLGKQTLGGHNETCWHQDPGERSSDPTRNWARLACEHPGVSGRGVGWQWPTAGSGLWLQQTWEPLNAGIRPFEGGCHYHSLAWGQTTGREHSPTHQQKIGLKIYWARPSFPHSQSLSSGSLHKPLILILIHQRADRMKTTITEN